MQIKEGWGSVKVNPKQIEQVKRDNYMRGLKAGLVIGGIVAVIVFIVMAHIIINIAQ